MAHDQETYRRGWSAALIGLIVQVVLTLVVALLGLWTENAALNTALWHVLGGVLIWIVLLLLYNQHRLERVEALEAEQLSSKDKQAAAIFAEHADDLDLARRRLDNLYKYGLNVISALVAVYLIALGGLFFFQRYQMVKNAPSFSVTDLVTKVIGERVDPMIMMFCVAGVAFVMFIVARYISGMTKVREWQLLRGGAAYMMGNFGVMLLILIGALLAYFESPSMLGLMALVTPAIMVLVGIEILVTFMLGAYRPRRPGEIPRPAFDSRVLGMLTSPDSLGRIITETLNYQFGFEVSRSWFYQQLGRSATKLFAAGLLILLFASMIIVVPPHQQAIRMVNGKASQNSILEPGLHFKLPWPFGGVEYHSVGEVHQLWIGSAKAKTDQATAILWTTAHEENADKKNYLITAPAPAMESTTAGTAVDATGGMGLLAGEVTVDYRISDLWKYVNGTKDPAAMIRAIGDRRVNAHFASNTLDALLGEGRKTASQTLRTQIQEDATAMGLGVEIVFVGITGVHPPADKDVAKSFHDVIGALSKKNAAIEEAKKNAIKALATVAGSEEQALAIDAAIAEVEKLKETAADAAVIQEKEAKIVSLLADASGDAARMVYDAQAYRWERGVTEAAAAARFKSELMADATASEYYRARQYLRTLAAGLSASRKYILTAGQAEPPEFRIDLHDSRTALGDLFDDKKK